MVWNIVGPDVSVNLRRLKTASVVTLAMIALHDKIAASKLVMAFSSLMMRYNDPVLLINQIIAIADIGER